MPHDAPKWCPIETAPREPVELDVLNEDPRLPWSRMRMGPIIVVRGTYEGVTEQFIVVWTVLDEEEGYWCSETEPVDWPLTEWRELTADERKEFADAD